MQTTNTNIYDIKKQFTNRINKADNPESLNLLAYMLTINETLPRHERQTLATLLVEKRKQLTNNN